MKANLFIATLTCIPSVSHKWGFGYLNQQFICIVDHNWSINFREHLYLFSEEKIKRILIQCCVCHHIMQLKHSDSSSEYESQSFEIY